MCRKYINVRFGIFYLIVLFTLLSCDKNERLPLIVKHTNEIQINISGSFDKSQTRTLDFSGEGEGTDTPKNKIIWKAGQDLPIVIVLKKQDNSRTIVAKGMGIVQKNQDTYDFKFDASYESTDPISIDDSWYMTGIIGGSIEANDSRLQIDIPTELKKNVRQLDIPISFPWKHISTDDVTGGNFIDMNGVVFKPIGNLIGFNISSEFRDPAELESMHIKTNLFTYNGYFDLNNSDVVEGGFLDYKTSSNSDDLSYSFVDENIDELTLNPNNPIGYFYTWVMNKKDVQNKELSIGFTLKPISRDPIPYIEKEKIHSYDTPRDALWSPKMDNIPSLENGKPYFVNAVVRCVDPIISEVYHYEEGGNNYSIIELYNPSNKPIDISKYYLIRLRDYGLFHYSRNFDDAYMFPIRFYQEFQGRSTNFVFDSNRAIQTKMYYDTQSSPELSSGKTIVIGANGYYDRVSFENINYSVGSYVKSKNFDTGKIQTIAGVHNAYTQYNSPNSEHSLTTQLGYNNGLILVKIVKDGTPYDKEVKTLDTSFKYLIVDSYGPYYNTNQRIPNFIPDGSNRFYMTRYDGILYPSGTEYKPDQWGFGTPPDNDPISSIGSRYRWWIDNNEYLEIPSMGEGN